MDLVDIDKLIDELEGSEGLKTSNVVSNASQVGSLQQIPSTKKNPVSSVFSSLNDYVNSAIDEPTTKTCDLAEEEQIQQNEKKVDVDIKARNNGSNNKKSIRKFSNPNYAYDDINLSSDEDSEVVEQQLRERLAKQESHESHATTFFESSSSSGTATTSSTTNEEDESLANAAGAAIPTTASTVPMSMDMSTTLSGDVINFDGISSISSMIEITSNYNKLKSDCKDESGLRKEENIIEEEEIASKTSDMIIGDPELVDIERPELPVPENTTKTDERKIVVGFESTMDDVSDTELESYLQELEEEEVHDESPSNEEEGDNLSKASTIEFNEVKEVKPSEESKINEDEEEPKIEESSMFKSMELKFVDSTTTDISQTKEIEEISEQINEDELVNQVELEPSTDVAVEQSEVIEKMDTETQELSSNEQEVEEVVVVVSNDEIKEQFQEDADEIVEIRDNTSTQEIEPKIPRPNSLDITPVTPAIEQSQSPGNTPPPQQPQTIIGDETTITSSSSEDFSIPTSENPIPNQPLESHAQLGKVPPYWIPDNMTNNCMQCNQKFSLIKRRHHCRACGQLLCSNCCCLKAKLEYMGEVEARICIQCDLILSRQEADAITITTNETHPTRQPNPNNPMEYCSTVPPHQQVASGSSAPISVMVPVGVLKRDGQPRNGRKNVIFSDGIRPGTDLTDLDLDPQPKSDGMTSSRKSKNRVQTPPGNNFGKGGHFKVNTKIPPIDEENRSYIPKKENALPPIYSQTKTEFEFTDVNNDAALITRLQTETLQFAIQRNFYVYCKVISLTCCVNKTVINFTTKGLHHVGQDELIFLLELDDSNLIPKDIFLHFNEIYNEADKGNVISELGFTMPSMQNFLGSKEHGGFLYIRPSFQCLQNIILPESPYLIGILIHRWEVPWAKIFPLRLMLRLGALYRYYPTPHISVRRRDSVYAEIAQTIINFLADFRTYTYTIPTIRGMVIHMEDRKTSVLIPRNRYDQVMKALSNASDNILALTGNFSKKADGHLVCIQNTEGPEQLYSYSTQAINIQGQPRKVTGASFIVLNGALKSSSGLSGKCNIVEDGLMVQIMPTKMTAIRDALKNMKDTEIVCGPVDADPSQTEIVEILWTENDLNFNIGVISPIDKKPMDGIPSIRVHRGLDFSNANQMIRWTEVFIIKSDDESAHGRDPVDISRVSEQIARSTCQAMVSFLNLLAANELVRIGVRVTLDPENVCYEAGSNFVKLAPLYMNALDNELIATLDRQASNLDQPIILELIFHILDK